MTQCRLALTQEAQRSLSSSADSFSGNTSHKMPHDDSNILTRIPCPPPQCVKILAMSEIIFMVEEAPEGGYSARALGQSIFAEGDDLAALHANVRDAVRCHFDDGQAPKVVRLHFVREEVIAV